MVDEESEIVIIGAGAAGLAAGGELGKAGLRVTILEARDRVGGRIDTIHDSRWPVPVERGAEFLHGVVPDVWTYLQDEKIIPYECHQEHWHLRGSRLSRLDMWEEVDRILSRMPRSGKDSSFDGFVKRNAKKLPRGHARQLSYLYVQGLNAAEASRISVRSLVTGAKYEEKIEADRLFRPLRGFDELTHRLRTRAEEAGVVVHLEEPVKTVSWTRGRVEATTTKRTLLAKQAIVTIPLGVLQATPGERGAIEFRPAIPKKIETARRLAMGPVVKVALLFSDAFWETRRIRTLSRSKTLRDMSFLFGEKLKVPVWWTYLPLRTRVLMGWAGGPHAQALSKLSRSEILAAGLESLGRLLGLRPAELRKDLEASEVAEWQSDPFSRGAYSYVPVGALAAVKELAQPIDDTLFFAGEATQHEGMSATVAGAVQTGWRAAREILRAHER